MDPLSEAPGRDGAEDKVGFVTGRLAEFSLRALIEKIEPELNYSACVIPLNIAVAALMTCDWVARKISVPEGITRLVLPGFCKGDLSKVETVTGLPVRRGPKDLRELPAWLGRPPEADTYGAFDIEIVAEINHVPQLELAEIVRTARKYSHDGADIIDLGCDPDGPFERLGEVVRTLREEGLRVSVDSLDPREIRSAVDAGAELVLSVNSSNIEVARDLEAEVVVIPDEPSSLSGLERSVERLEAWGTSYRLDPVLEPIAFGFAASLGRYLEVRRRYPESRMLMGIGNLTELTDADSAGLNILLLGFCQEIGVDSVLTTEVISWAETSVKECDLARRLVHFACSERTLPKHREPLLHLLRDPRVLEHGEAVIESLAAGIKDDNFRIFAESGWIHVLSRSGHLRGTDPFDLFDELGVSDPSHAFYLGYEMAKAVTALTLGKNYVQDEALSWGFLTREETSHLEKRKERKDADD